MKQNSVTKRHVFYIPGYDPYPPRRYRELFRKESIRQAKISGYDIAIRAQPGRRGYGWEIAAAIDGTTVRSQYDVLGWSDIVQKSMKNGIGATYLQMAKTAWVYIGSGAMRRMMHLRKGPVIAAFYPVAVLLAQALVAVLAGVVLGGLVGKLTIGAAGWVVALPLIVYILQRFQKMDRRFLAYYLMHDYAYTAGLRGKNPPLLEARINQFSRRIIAALKSDVDEVLVVGHSSGAHLAVNILATALRATPSRSGDPKLAFLSLGQVIPMVSFLPDAGQLRRDLNYLSVSDGLTWVDVSAPGDGCSFALCDPVAVSGVASAGKRWPLVLSAAFSQTLSPERWQALKRRYFRLHFQYLCAFDRPGDYDYFQITAGPRTLAQRYANRAPSKSRIDVAASPYTSMVP